VELQGASQALFLKNYLMGFNGFILPLNSRVITACRRAARGWLELFGEWVLNAAGARSSP